MLDDVTLDLFAANACEEHGLVCSHLENGELSLADPRVPGRPVFYISRGNNYVEVRVDSFAISAPAAIAFCKLLNEFKALVELLGLDVTITIRPSKPSPIK